MKKIIITCALIILAACSTTPVPMTYTPNQSAVNYNRPLVAVGEVKDDRKYKGTALGSVRNGFGAQALTLQLEKPASDVIRDAVNKGLQSRGLLASGEGKYVMNIDIIKFDCNKYAHREAHVELNVSMVAKSSNQVVYTNTIVANKVDGSMWEVSFSQVDQLKAVANQALQDSIDQLLNDPAFIAKVI